MFWHTVHDHQLGENFENIFAVEAARHFDGQAFSRELINDGEHAQPFAVPGSVLNKVVGPDMIAVLRPESHTRPVIQP